MLSSEDCIQLKTPNCLSFFPVASLGSLYQVKKEMDSADVVKKVGNEQ